MARRRRLPVLIRVHDYKCFWCKEPIILRREVPNEQIIQEKHGIITITDGPVVKEIKLASVDHVKSLADGGTNDWDNCVPSCWFCNNKRSNSSPSSNSEKC